MSDEAPPSATTQPLVQATQHHHREKSVILVEEPETIIELVDLYVPPPITAHQVFFMNQPRAPPAMQIHQAPLVPNYHIPLQLQYPQPLNNHSLWYQVTPPTSFLYQASATKPPLLDPPSNTSTATGRKRGRKPSGSGTRSRTVPEKGAARAGGGSGGRAPKRPRKTEIPPPPPLPPPPNFLENFINPLENEIYPKVIVQPAHQPWVLPKNLHEDPKPLKTPPALCPPSAPPQQATNVEPHGSVPVVSGSGATAPQSQTQSIPAMPSAQLCQYLKLFGPNVTISRLPSPEHNRYLAVLRQANGQQRHLVFTAEQLNSFIGPRISAHINPSANPVPKVVPQQTQVQYVKVQQAPVFKMPTARAPIRVLPKAARQFLPPAPPAPPAIPEPTTPNTADEQPAPTPARPQIQIPLASDGFALPSILKLKSQIKLRNMLQIQRAKALAKARAAAEAEAKAEAEAEAKAEAEAEAEAVRIRELQAAQHALTAQNDLESKISRLTQIPESSLSAWKYRDFQ